MKKRVNRYAFAFWSLLALVLVFALGVQFAHSQSGGFATTNPSSGSAWHSASSVVCDNCITSGNIADNAVTAGEIANGVITDSDVSDNAGIHIRKTGGGNGWLFTSSVPNNPSPVTVWQIVSSNSLNGRLDNWNGAIVETLCSPDGLLRTYAGQTAIGGSVWKWNHNTVTLSNSVGQIIYRAETSSGSITIELKPCANIAECGSSSVPINSKLMLRRSTTGTPPEAIGSITCHLKVLSLCDGSPTCA